VVSDDEEIDDAEKELSGEVDENQKEEYQPSADEEEEIEEEVEEEEIIDENVSEYDGSDNESGKKKKPKTQKLSVSRSLTV
jgi:hypothetical protein